MKSSGIAIPRLHSTTQQEAREYLIVQGLELIVDASNERDLTVNEKLESIAPYKPNVVDLCRLHRLVIETKRTTLLEFGTGWSTWVLADALSKLKKEYVEQISDLRRNNPFELHVLDDESKYIEIAKSRLPDSLKELVTFHLSPATMGTFQDRICTYYAHLPLVNPDFIYVDGPDQFNVKETCINGWSTRHKDLMPMSADLLRIEHFLTPGTIVIFDGRAANARFCYANFQRNWIYEYNALYDQHVFCLAEMPLGIYNKRHIDFGYSR
jgi:hypothetical protein